jgi:hypothetical protein
VLAVENIIPQYQTDIVSTNKLLSNNKGLSQPLWSRLLCIGQANPKLAAISQHTLKAR